MSMIVVGGQRRKIGKTELVATILHDFPQLCWTAVKFTSHLHDPQGCEVLASGEGFTVWRQSKPGVEKRPAAAGGVSTTPPSTQTDTARFLEAGAARALLIQTHSHALEQSCDWLRGHIAEAETVIVEATNAAEFLVPDLFLMLLDPASADFKESAMRLLWRTNVCIMTGANIPSQALRSLIGSKSLIHLGIPEDQQTLRNLIRSRAGGSGDKICRFKPDGMNGH